MLRPKRGRIRFNDGEAAYLRSCMRRFGWERRRDSGANCLWEETFSGVKLNDAVWWLVEQILQTRVSAEACIRHDPISISKARHSLAGISEATLALHADIIAWQQNNQSSSLPSEMEDSKLYSRISNYMDSQRNKRWKKLYVSYPFKLLAGYSVGKEGDPSQDGQMEHDIASGESKVWRSEEERALTLMHGIPGWKEEHRCKERFLPLVDMLRLEVSDSVAFQVLQDLQTLDGSLDVLIQQAARKLDCIPSITSVSTALASRLLRSFPEEPENCLPKYVCRLCSHEEHTMKDFEEHVQGRHLNGVLMSRSRSFAEYRKKVFGLVERQGPTVSWLQGL